MRPKNRPSSGGRPCVALVFLLGVAALTGCYREVSDVTAQPRDPGTAPWTIRGVRPGQTLAAVEQLLGPADERVGSTNQPSYRWAKLSEFLVTCDARGVVTEVYGTQLDAGGKTLIWTGLGQADVEHILGKGDVRKSYRPKGSGVISIGRELVGVTVIHERDGLRFEIGLTEDSVRGVWIRGSAAGSR